MAGGGHSSRFTLTQASSTNMKLKSLHMHPGYSPVASGGHDFSTAAHTPIANIITIALII